MNEHQIDATQPRPQKTHRSAVPMAVAPAIVALLAVLTMGLALPDLSEAAFHPDAQRCRMGFGKVAEKFAKTIQKVVYKCHKARRDGKIPASVDCTDMDQDGANITHIDIAKLIERFESRLRGIPGFRCGGVLPHHIGMETCPVGPTDCPTAPYTDFSVNTTNDLYKCFTCLVLSEIPQMMQDSLGHPIVAKACSGGTADGQACLRNNDCGGGSCDDVPVCAGGVNDGAPCSSDNDCGVGVCGVFDPTTDGKCHHTIARVQSRHASKFLTKHAQCRRKDEKLGGIAPANWCTAETCVDHAQSCKNARECVADGADKNTEEKAWTCIDKRCHAACTVTGEGAILGCGNGESCVAGACRKDCATAENVCVGGPYDGIQCFGNKECGSKSGGKCVNTTCNTTTPYGTEAVCLDNSDLKRELPKSRRGGVGAIASSCKKADLYRVPTCADPYVCVGGDSPGAACQTATDCGAGGEGDPTCEANFAGIAECTLDDAEAAGTTLFANFYQPIACGDGGIDSGEECDDGPYDLNNEDGCNEDCTVPRCGDGFVQKDDIQCSQCSRNVVRGCEIEGTRQDWRCGYCLDTVCKGKAKCEKVSGLGGCGSTWVGYRGYSANSGLKVCTGPDDAPGDGKIYLPCSGNADCATPELCGWSTRCEGGLFDDQACATDTDCGVCDANGNGLADDSIPCISSAMANCGPESCGGDGTTCVENSGCGEGVACLVEVGTCSTDLLADDNSFCLWQGDTASVSTCTGGIYDAEVCNPDRDCCNGLTRAGGCKPNSGYCGDDDICVGGKNQGNPCNPSIDCYDGTCTSAPEDLVCEACDWSDLFNSAEPNQCRTDCQLATCGDGVVDAKNNEACDDGNTIDTDNCNNFCEVSGCGNGEVDLDNEQCDDGNLYSDDLCTAQCMFNVCGDGAVCRDSSCGDSLEGCDDGNTDNWDGCSSDCQEEFCSVGDTCSSNSNCPVDAASGTNFACVENACAVYTACPSNQTLDASGACECPTPQFQLVGDVCTDVDECAAEVSPCAGVSAPFTGACVNLNGSYSCAIECTQDAFHDALNACGHQNTHGERSITFDCSTQDLDGDGATTIYIAAGAVDSSTLIQDWGHASGDGPRATDIRKRFQNIIGDDVPACRNDFLIDGRGHDITFELTDLCGTYHLTSGGACTQFASDLGTEYITGHGCTEVERGTGFLQLKGNGNTVRNLAVKGFFEGIQVEGSNNTIDSMTFDGQCDDSLTTGWKTTLDQGVGNTYSNLVIRNGCDKCIQLYGGDTAALSAGTGACPLNDAVPYSSEFNSVHVIDCAKPIRGILGGGNFLFKNSVISATSRIDGCTEGAKLSSRTEEGGTPFLIEFRDSVIERCGSGMRLGGNTEAIFSGSTIRDNYKVGVLVRKSAKASFNNNTITGNGGEVSGGSGEKGYGGVALDPVTNSETPEMDLGGGSISFGGGGIAESDVSSPGVNTFCNNSDHRRGQGGLDVDNYTDTPIPAQGNIWCETPPKTSGTGVNW